jgi:hypothetical protein
MASMRTLRDVSGSTVSAKPGRAVGRPAGTQEGARRV